MNPSNNQTLASSVGDVMALVSDSCRPLNTETLPISSSLHRVLRERICAPEAQPQFDRSSVDGYAVRLDDPGMKFAIVDRIRAGEWKPRALKSGEAVQIATGGALPCAELQVVMKEDVETEGNQVRLNRRDKDLHLCLRGSDARQGQILIDSGALLHPGALAILASIGHTQLTVTRLPRVFHAATGNEIVPPEATPQPGQIRDSNSLLVRAFLNQWNIHPEQLRLPEEEAAVYAVLSGQTVRLGETIAAQADILLISGGASVGEHDFTRRLLEKLGYDIKISKTNTRPGKPLIFGTRGNAVAFGLPGNPLAHFVCLNLFVRAAIEKLSGLDPRHFPAIGLLTSDLEDAQSPRETLWPARYELSAEGLLLTPLPWNSSGDLTSLASANALARIPTATKRLAKGASIEFFPITIPA